MPPLEEDDDSPKFQFVLLPPSFHGPALASISVNPVASLCSTSPIPDATAVPSTSKSHPAVALSVCPSAVKFPPMSQTQPFIVSAAPSNKNAAAHEQLPTMVMSWPLGSKSPVPVEVPVNESVVNVPVSTRFPADLLMTISSIVLLRKLTSWFAAPVRFIVPVPFVQVSTPTVSERVTSPWNVRSWSFISTSYAATSALKVMSPLKIHAPPIVAVSAFASPSKSMVPPYVTAFTVRVRWN
jgi:hypothetical protein